MEALRDKLKWLMGIRVAVVTLTLGVLIYLQIGKSTQAIPAYYGLIVAPYLLTILYGLLVNRIEWLVTFAYLQLGLESVFETVLLAFPSGLHEFHQFVVESIDGGLFTTDPEGRLTSFNRRAEEIMGYSQMEVRGRSWWEVFAWPAPTGQSRIPPAGMSHRLEEVGRRKDG